jgi:Carboxypeptidase regulatory-like domain
MLIAKTMRVALALALVGAAVAHAQESRGRVQGAVADSTGATVPGATAILTNDNTGIAVTRTTNRDGRYLFDYVDPGTYTLSVTLTGFSTGVQKNIRVQQQADVTVDVKLAVGEMSETVTVTESPVALQFNTATRNLTVEQEMVRELPSFTGNPLQLAKLDPTVVGRGSPLEVQPYFHRTANEADMGGGTKFRNDIVLDGTPLTAGNKLGYTPPSDAVNEYTVQQNTVDAEFGHNAGGVAIVTLKSGSNEVRGTAYYNGRAAKLNAETDRALHVNSPNSYWNAGATVGLPLIKNKLFVFGVFEKIEATQPTTGTYTLPTALERQGDFSQSFNANGTLRVIYDPLSAVPTADGRNFTRTPFPGNKIPANRWDPVAAKVLANLWQPNNAGDDRTNLNNFKYSEDRTFHYNNFSTRLDWQGSENWKTWARVSRIKTDQDASDFTDGNDPLRLRNTTGSKRNGWNIAADSVYTLNPTTSFDVRGAFYQVEDKRDFPDMNIGDYSSIWPNAWWQPYMAGRPLVYAPNIQVGGTQNTFGVANFWFQEPNGYSVHGRFNKYLTKHSIKAGTEIRWKRGDAARYRFTTFNFSASPTGNQFTSPSATTGNPWASFLLGSMDTGTNSTAQFTPLQVANTEMYAVYVQDDFKVSKSVTLNLGLRYEYEGGYWDPQYRIQQQLDLTDPIPGLAAAVDSKFSADAKAKMAESTGQNSYIFNGAFHFTEAGNKHGTSADKLGFMPRIGLAWRVDDRTAVRFGYGRFNTPTSLIMPDRDANGEMPLGSFTPVTSVLGAQNGIPQASFSDPFPQGLTSPYGKAYGRYTQLGDAVTIDEFEQRPPISDRFSLSLQHELPWKVILDATYMLNFVTRDQWTEQLNLADPRLTYKYGAALNAAVPNPFFNYGTVDTFPGPLRNQPTVTLGSLLRPYPQYGAILQTATDLRSTHYKSLQVRLQRPFSKGVSVLLTYAYATARTQAYFDIQDEYDGKLSWIDGDYSPPGGTGTNLTYTIDPTHRIAAAVTAQLPIGHGHAIGGNMSGVLDALLGGWQVSGVFNYTSGQKLVFPTGVAPDSVNQVSTVGGAADQFWFETTGFAVQPANTRRVNPWYYDNVTGPDFKNVDASLAKRFALNKRFKVQIRIDAFNALNSMNWANPNLTIGNSAFGKVNTQALGYFGRQVQFGARLQF